MRDLREAVLQALAFTMRDFATVRDFEAAKAKLRDSLRAALDSDTGEPDLLAALQWALSQIEDSLDPDHQAALESARAVAARATGR